MRIKIIMCIAILLLSVLLVSAGCAGKKPMVDVADEMTEDDAVPVNGEADVLSVSEVNTEKEYEYDENGNRITSHNGKPDPVITEDVNFFQGQRAEIFSASNGYRIPYRIYVPLDYDEKYAYPVIVFFHGLGSGGIDNSQHLYSWMIVDSFKENSALTQAIIISPQSPDDCWVDYGLCGYSMDEVEYTNSMDGVIELLDHINATYSTNLNRQYVLGSSAGGFATWYAISKYPEKFTAAAPCCGGGDPNYAYLLKDMYIHVYHDVTDDTIPVIGSRRMVDAILGVGSEKLEYTETNGYGHDPWGGLDREGKLDVIDWLFSKVKE